MPPSKDVLLTSELEGATSESEAVNPIESDRDGDFEPSHSGPQKRKASRAKSKITKARPRKKTTNAMSRVSRTESGTRSSSVFSDSSAPSTPMTETKALDWTAGPHSSLEELLQKEEQLQIQIDSLTEEIKALRGQNNQEEVKDADQEDEDVDYSNFDAPQWCVPIKANVMTFEWDKLGDACQFDVILMDPPWQLASHAPTRGVAIAYQQLPDACIEELPIPKLQTNGFIFIWVINNKYVKAFELMERWGYEYVDDITWVKQTVNRRMAKGHGYYLQHAKETCLVGKKGNDPEGCRHGVASDVIFSERRGQSQKPEELYEIIEELIPNGKYLEIFGRKNNLRDFWVTVGNEL